MKVQLENLSGEWTIEDLPMLELCRLYVESRNAIIFRTGMTPDEFLTKMNRLLMSSPAGR
jgi:hypothetical protein